MFYFNAFKLSFWFLVRLPFAVVLGGVCMNCLYISPNLDFIWGGFGFECLDLSIGCSVYSYVSPWDY